MSTSANNDLCLLCNNQQLMLAVYKKRVYFMYKMHMELAYANNALEAFLKEWSPYQPLLEDVNN